VIYAIEYAAVVKTAPAIRRHRSPIAFRPFADVAMPIQELSREEERDRRKVAILRIERRRFLIKPTTTYGRISKFWHSEKKISYATAEA
jgi:hypothetical protein